MRGYPRPALAGFCDESAPGVRKTVTRAALSVRCRGGALPRPCPGLAWNFRRPHKAGAVQPPEPASLRNLSPGGHIGPPLRDVEGFQEPTGLFLAETSAAGAGRSPPPTLLLEIPWEAEFFPLKGRADPHGRSADWPRNDSGWGWRFVPLSPVLNRETPGVIVTPGVFLFYFWMAGNSFCMALLRPRAAERSQKAAMPKAAWTRLEGIPAAAPTREPVSMPSKTQ